MDVTSLTLLFLLFVSAVGVDTALHPTSVVLEAAVAGKLDNVTIDSDTLSGMFNYEVTQICSTPSLLAPPEIEPSGSKGLGMAFAEAIKMQSVALALQAQLGYHPERIKMTLLGENGTIKMLVSGGGMGGRIRRPAFQDELILQKGESLPAFVHRGALLGMEEVDPYTSSLYLVQAHLADGDFSQAEALIKRTQLLLAPAPMSFDRSVFENLQGIVELLRGNIDKADVWFHTAITSYPTNPAASLNAAFVDVQAGQYQAAAQHVEVLLAANPPADKTLLATAYLTWGAAELGLNQVDEAERKLAQAVQADPTVAAVYEFWSEVKRAKGDVEAADRLHAKAWEAAADQFENYAEAAALYFMLPSKPGQPLTRSPFVSLGLIQTN